MSLTPNLGLPYIDAGQAQKHVTHNEALRSLDALVQLAVLDRDLAAPPSSPAEGERWIVAPAASGAWASHTGHVAAWQDGAWRFSAPVTGWVAYVVDEEMLIAWDGSSWNSVSGGGGSVDLSELQDVALLGIGTTADATNPLSARLNNALWAAKTVAEGGDGTLRYIMSKESAAKNLSLLLQDNFVGCAEIGLTGDDDFHFKVSPDGTSWLEAIKIDRASGKVSFPVSGGPREVLTAARTYYVDFAAGSDSNSGLSSGAAFKNIQAAYDAAAKIDCGGFNVTIKLADSSSYGGLTINTPLVGGNLYINGNSSTPANVQIGQLTVSCPQIVTVSNLRSSNGFSCFQTTHPAAVIKFGAGLSFAGSPSSAHLLIQSGKIEPGNQNFTVASGGLRWLSVQTGGVFNAFNSTITFSGTPAWSGEGVYYETCGVVSFFNVTMSGSATGKRYTGIMGGMMNSFGAGSASTYFPGNSNGTTATGAQQG